MKRGRGGRDGSTPGSPPDDDSFLVQMFVLSQLGELRAPLARLASSIDDMVIQGFIGPDDHWEWRATLALLDSYESEMWKIQISTNNRQTMHWPRLVAPDGCEFSAFANLRPEIRPVGPTIQPPKE